MLQTRMRVKAVVAKSLRLINGHREITHHGTPGMLRRLTIDTLFSMAWFYTTPNTAVTLAVF